VVTNEGFLGRGRPRFWKAIFDAAPGSPINTELESVSSSIPTIFHVRQG